MERLFLPSRAFFPCSYSAKSRPKHERFASCASYLTKFGLRRISRKCAFLKNVFKKQLGRYVKERFYKEDRAVFLSSGYATHVLLITCRYMYIRSFENIHNVESTIRLLFTILVFLQLRKL